MQRIPDQPVVTLPPIGVPEVIGECLKCHGQIIQVRHELRVEAGGEIITKSEYEVHCSGCGSDWEV
jgi:aspartate carbamoyltransferase regulatory subunit